MSRQTSRATETKRAILSAAKQLFAERGFDSVTMREIAKKAACSHTTIYLYFKDKEALLHELSMPLLLKLEQQLANIMECDRSSPEKKLKGVGREFIQFCLIHRNIFPLLFVTKAIRVDTKKIDSEMNEVRMRLFNQMTTALGECLQNAKSSPQLLTFSRIYFYTLHGIVGTYIYSEESPQALMERLQSTFDAAMDVLLLGFQQKGADSK